MRREVRAGKGQGMGRRRTVQGGGQGTSNMLRMFVTLDVSKATGWSNFPAVCVPWSRKGGIRCGARSGPEGGRGRVAAAVCKLSVQGCMDRTEGWRTYAGQARSACTPRTCSSCP